MVSSRTKSADRVSFGRPVPRDDPQSDDIQYHDKPRDCREFARSKKYRNLTGRTDCRTDRRHTFSPLDSLPACVRTEARDVLNEKPAPNHKSAPVRPFLTGFLAAVMLLAGAFLLWQRFGQSSDVTNSPPRTGISTHNSADGTDLLARLVAEETAKLHVKPHTIVLTTDKALSASEALRQGDYQSAEVIAKKVLAQSKLESFSFHPFNTFANNLSEGDDPKFLGGLNAWISHSPQSALPYLIRAKYYTDTAWLIRGDDFDIAVPEKHKQAFREFMDRAEDDVRRSIALDSGIPWSYFLLLQISGGRENSQQMDQVFRDGIARFPAYYELYRIRLHYLQPKWGGSAEDMHQFVNQYAGTAPASSPLKLLYVQLTANLLNAAWVECRNLQHEMLTACIDRYMDHYVTAGLVEGVAKAFGVYKHTDSIQFSTALWPILGDMISTPGDSTVTTTVLQLAGDAMGSDNQLIHESGHNNYVLDDITARVWSKLDNPVNVEQKFQEALADVERMSFASEDDKDAALGILYEDMTWVARNTSQYAKVIADYEAANSVAGVNRGGSRDWKCYAYYKLHHFKEAVGECTHQIETRRDVGSARYSRAQSYEQLRNYDAALADYALIAENGSNNYLRDGAVIEMDHINALLGKYAVEIQIFDKYPFVLDASLQAPDDLAAAYNNRCFAYMKLGELHKALDDCTTSLRYGRMPDALQKQQELQKRLSQQTT
jgi:tetratricopeptide (TPR) repeat protein